MGFRRELVPWLVLPQEAVSVRQELRPIGGILPGGYGTADTAGAPLTLGAGITRSGAALDFSSSNTGLTRTVAAEYPLTLVFRGSTRNTSFRCISAIATSADKTVRVFALDGVVRAQHIGGSTNASADTPTVFNYSRSFNCVAVFESATMVRVYGAGTAGRGSGSSTTNIGALTTLTRLSHGVYDGSAKLYQQDGVTEIAQWLNYAPTAEEAWAWVDNPQAIFEPQSTPIYVAAGGGASFNPAWAIRNARTIGAGVI